MDTNYLGRVETIMSDICEYDDNTDQTNCCETDKTKPLGSCQITNEPHHEQCCDLNCDQLWRVI